MNFTSWRKGNDEPFSAMQSVLLLLQLTLYRGMARASIKKKKKRGKEKEEERIGGKERGRMEEGDKKRRVLKISVSGMASKN